MSTEMFFVHFLSGIGILKICTMSCWMKMAIRLGGLRVLVSNAWCR
jgi:hypothetical protein